MTLQNDIYTDTERNLQEIRITEKETIIVISGFYTVDEAGKEKKYNFSFDIMSVEADSIANIVAYLESNNLPIVVKLDNYFSSNPFMTVLISLLPTLIITVIVVFIFYKMLSNAGGNSKALEFGRSRARQVIRSTTTFNDVAGCYEEKVELAELVDYLKNPQRYTAMGAKFPKGVILEGPPGTGKTLLARAVAGEAGVPFLFISGSDFVEMFVGIGASRVRDLFKEAKAKAPAIIFIDEIDAVGRQRGTGLGGGNDEREQTLNQLLVEFDGFEENQGILIIAATNRADVLDPALMRAGRFDRQITVTLPDRISRREILKVHSRNKWIASTVDFDYVASITPGLSGAELANVMNEAAILAIRRNKSIVTMDEIHEGIDRTMGGLARTSRKVSEQEKKLTAFHEAGHAVIGLKVEHSSKVQKITIIPRGSVGGYVMMAPKEETSMKTRNELMATITSFLGGRTSEEIFFDDVTTGAHSDIEQATRIARMMVTELGMSNLGLIQYEDSSSSVFLGRDYASNSTRVSAQVAYEIDKAVREIIEECHLRARKTLEENKDLVTLIAETLLNKETLSADEIEELATTGKLDISIQKKQIEDNENRIQEEKKVLAEQQLNSAQSPDEIKNILDRLNNGK
ncbi:metalloprotease m41 ftsh [Holotrichia oblita]|nr:metalloprotease m41 ftsh [Holotrichia oblita]